MAQDIANPGKIEEMVSLFENELMPMYRKRAKEIIDGSSMLSLEKEINNDEHAKADRAENILAKYQLLCSEYQNQAKSFKQKHIEIAESEVSKREAIRANFESHFDNIKEQMEIDKQSLCEESGELKIVVENRSLEEKY